MYTIADLCTAQYEAEHDYCLAFHHLHNDIQTEATTEWTIGQFLPLLTNRFALYMLHKQSRSVPWSWRISPIHFLGGWHTKSLSSSSVLLDLVLFE